MTETQSEAIGVRAAVRTAATAPNFLPYLALAFGAIGMAFSAIFVKWAGAPGLVNGVYRMGIAALVMALPFGLEARQRRPLAPKYIGLAILAGMLFAGDLGTWNTSALITSAANSTLLANTSPLWVSLGAMVWFKERLNSAFWAGLLLALAGAVTILGADFLRHPTLGLGDLLALIAGFFYGAFFLAAQRAREGLSAMAAWWISAVASTIVLLILALAFQQPLFGYSVMTYVNLVGIALVTQVGAYLAITYALGHLPASIVSPTLLMQPVLTALLAVPLLGEHLSAVQISGGLIVIAGISLVHRSRGK